MPRKHIAFAALAAALIPAPAGAAAPGAGAECSYADTTLTTSPTHRTGVVTAGPYVIPLATRVTMVCGIQVGTADPAAPNDATVSHAHNGYGFVPPQSVEFAAEPGAPVYVCTFVSWRYPTVPSSGGSANLGCDLAPAGGG